MAEKVVVFEIDVQPITGQLASLGKSIEDTKARFEQLKKENGAYDEQTIATNAALKTLQKEYRSLETVLTNQSAAIGEVVKASQKQLNIKEIENNSIDTNRKLYNALYGEYVRAGKEQREKMIPTLKALSDELKKQEAAVGDTRRNVGNYAEGFKQAVGEIKLFGVSTQQVTSGLDAAKNGFKAAGGGVKGFAAALATTGLPLIVLGIQQLTAAFESFKPVAEAVENTVVGLKAAFGALITGGSISEAVKQSQALLEVLRDLEDTQDAFNIQNEKARNEIQRLIVASKDRTKSEQDRLKLIQEANAIEEKIFNESVSRVNEEVRARAKAFIEKNQISIQEYNLLTRGTSDEALELRKRLENQGTLKDEELKQIQEKVKERAKLEGESLVLQEKLQARTNQLLEKENEEREKAAQKARERREKEQQAEAQRLANIQKLQEEFLKTDREKLEKSFDDKIAIVPASEVKLLKAINDAKTAALKKFDADAEKKQQDEFNKNRAEIIAAESALINEQISLNQTLLENELKTVDLSVGNEQTKADKKRAIQLEYLQQQLTLVEKLAAADNMLSEQERANIEKLKLSIEELKQVSSTPTESGKNLGDVIGVNKEEQEKINEGLQVITQSVAAIGDIINASYQVRLNDIENVKNAEIAAIEQSGASADDKNKRIQAAERKAAMETYEIQKKQFETNKAIAIVQTIINTAQAVIAQLANPTPYVGIVLAALAAATGAAQIAVIASQQPPAPPKFAKGVIGLQGAGDETSDSIDAKLSKGESVMTAKATKQFAPILAQMEMAVGNKPNYQLGNKRFAVGYIPMGDGGYASRYAGADQSNNVAMADIVRSTVSSIPAPVVTVEEINRVQTSANNSVAVSEL